MRTAVVMNAEPAKASSSETTTLAVALQLGTARLSGAGIESARLDAEVLLRHVLDLERDGLFLRLEEPISAAGLERFEGLLERRAAREPLAYITGHKEFWSLDFIVTPAVLIPRPETELLVELILAEAREYSRHSPLRVLDIGTGSGAIAVALAKHLPGAEVWGIDVSAGALRVAQANAQTHGVEKRARFFAGDLFRALSEAEAIFEIIVSNPPYIRRGELATLAPEICRWEPAMALDGGADGLDFYRKIINGSAGHLRAGGKVFLETASDLAKAVAALFASAGSYQPAGIYQDYAGRDRVVAAMKGTGRG
jgi:release factor glutamine methyltransferase